MACVCFVYANATQYDMAAALLSLTFVHAWVSSAAMFATFF